jgi:hypothetical protein
MSFIPKFVIRGGRHVDALPNNIEVRLNSVRFCRLEVSTKCKSEVFFKLTFVVSTTLNRNF